MRLQELKDDAVEETIMRLRAAQDMIRLMLGNADAVEADAVIVEYAVNRT